LEPFKLDTYIIKKLSVLVKNEKFNYKKFRGEHVMSAQLFMLENPIYTDNLMSTSFSDELRAWRKSRKISMYELAKRIGVSESNLCSIEKGRRPASEDVLRRIASYEPLGITFEQLRAWQILEGTNPQEVEPLIKALGELKRQREANPKKRN
jgi:transcriptional regulator with XRE-family HTH domain